MWTHYVGKGLELWGYFDSGSKSNIIKFIKQDFCSEKLSNIVSGLGICFNRGS